MAVCIADYLLDGNVFNPAKCPVDALDSGIFLLKLIWSMVVDVMNMFL